MYNILIADDSMQLRSGLRHLIDWEAAGFRIGGEASDGQEALALMGKEPFDAVITDIQMPGMDGLELIRRCAQDHPGVKMIVISGYDDFAYARTAIQHGVADYLLKPIVRSELVAVLDKVRAELTRRLADNAERSRMRWTLDQQVSALREQFLVQLANGSANAAVSMRERAAQLQLDPLFADGANVRFVGAEMRIPPGRLEDDERQRDAMRLAFQTTCRDMARQEAARWLVFHDYNFPDMMFFIVGADPGGDPGGRLARQARQDGHPADAGALPERRHRDRRRAPVPGAVRPASGLCVLPARAEPRRDGRGGSARRGRGASDDRRLRSDGGDRTQDDARAGEGGQGSVRRTARPSVRGGG
ncbi:response regulator [Cohnella rhizosphaerae]|uniref:Response regulator n=1 Tax=Cohnella rhizosphaerae TaxID=1457232 RepID=A0A9X4KTH8_9BACL|nr:response regulator [Cohnella rhizosphaerae]MDG0809956.1 response regulator [Cohnella rhizosphaerae]